MFEWWVGEVLKRTEWLFDYVNMYIDLPLKYDFQTFKKLIDYLTHMLNMKNYNNFIDD